MRVVQMITVTNFFSLVSIAVVEKIVEKSLYIKLLVNDTGFDSSTYKMDFTNIYVLIVVSIVIGLIVLYKSDDKVNG